jgi:RNA polymerase sigma-70 factor (ECF subfamily)
VTDETFTMQAEVRGPWRRFIDAIAPLRPELLRYCRGLTGNVWDAEDLLQDALLRVFGALGKNDAPVTNPRAYLVRTATHIWFDRLRRLRLERAHALAPDLDEAAADDPSQVLAVRAAAAGLFQALPPQERAAVLMKDVLDLSLDETAAILRTTPGAVKSALHRGRGKLAEAQAGARPPSTTPRAVVDRFVAALAANDVEAIRALCLADMTIEMVGGAVSDSFDAGKLTFHFAHFVMPAMGFAESPRWEAVEYEGEPMVLGFRTADGVESLNEIWRFDVGEARIERTRLYCYSPDVLAEVAKDLGLTALRRPYLSPDR